MIYEPSNFHFIKIEVLWFVTLISLINVEVGIDVEYVHLTLSRGRHELLAE